MLNPVHLQTLAAVIRSGSFAAAAKSLGYTASAISQQMSALEHQARVVLFERSARSIRPTTTAVVLSERSAEVLALLDRLDDEVRLIAGGSIGRVRIGSFPTASKYVLPGAVARVAAQLPDVRVEIEEGEPDELIPLVVERLVDLAVVYEYDVVPRSWPRNLQRIHLISEDLVLLVPTNHRLGGASVQLRDLKSEVWISTVLGTSGSECLSRLCAGEGFVPRIDFRTNDYDVVTRFVSEGLGVALVPERGVSPGAQVRTAHLDSSQAQRRTIAVHRRVGANPIVSSVVEALLSATKATPNMGKDH